MWSAADGRYLDGAEQALLRDFAQGLDDRLKAMTEVAAKETVIVEKTVREILHAYPDVEKKYKTAVASSTRDITLVLRYATLAMVRSDPQYLNDSVLTWMATILKGLGMAPAFVEDTYKTLNLAATKELSPSAAKLLQPFLTQCTAVLSGRAASDNAAPPAER
jgi:hypothetical protein